MMELRTLFSRASEPPAFDLKGHNILDPIGPPAVGLREGSTTGGMPTVTLVIPVADKTVAILETSWRLWSMATDAMKGAIERWAKTPEPGSAGERNQAMNDALVRAAEAGKLFQALCKVDAARLDEVVNYLKANLVFTPDSVYLEYVLGLIRQLTKATAP